MKNKTPCKDCRDRTITCHGVCRRYQAWKKELDEYNAMRREERAKDDTISDHSKRRNWANQRLTARKYLAKK